MELQRLIIYLIIIGVILAIVPIASEVRRIIYGLLVLLVVLVLVDGLGGFHFWIH